MAHTVAPASIESSFTTLPSAATHKPLVLVIDPDESTRSVLEVALTRDGFDVWSASAAPAGMTLLQGRLPDVIVLESDLGGQDGFTFIAQLRGDDRLAKLPVLLLAKADDQNVEAMADVVGADDFIQKPAYARDVAAMVRVELAKQEQGSAGPLRFDSKVLPPVQLLRALMSCPRSGRLMLVGGRAEIRFRSGKIIDARFEGRGGNVDTVVRALALTSGTYELVLAPVDGFAELQCSLRELIELVLPRLQKWARVLARSLPLDSRLAVDFARLATGLKAMPDEVNHIVQLFDGFRTVEQALIDSTFNETLTLEVATRLYLMGVLAPVKGTEDAFVVLRPMPRLFEPRASEAEELMQQLFDGTAEIRGTESAEQNDADWVTQAGTGLEMSDPNGGWTTAPVPQMLAEGLSPELARQLDAFQTPMHVEAAPVAPEAVVAQKFADREPQLPVDTAMESALMLAANETESVESIEANLNSALAVDALAELEAAHREQARGKQARIETPWMTPIVELPVVAQVANSPSTVEVSLSEPVTDRSVTPILTPAVAAVGMPAQLRIQTPVLTKSAIDPADAFFLSEEPSAALSLENAMPVRNERRMWPFLVGALVIGALALAFEMMRDPTPAAVVEAPKPVVVVAPVLPDIEPPEFIETEVEAAAPAIDVGENLDEARKLYEGGQYKKALSVLEQVVTDDPKSVAAWNLIGLARYDSLDPVGARAAADKVLELDPKNGRVQILLATLYFDANDKQNGRAALEKYLELEPNGSSVDEAKALLKRP